MSTSTASVDSLHPRIAELFAELDASRSELHALLSALPSELLHAPAVGEQWSVGQILEHLAVVEDGSGRFVSKIIHEVEATGARETDSSSILDVNDRFAIATSNVRIPAPERVLPKEGLAPEASMKRLDEMRDKLKSVLRRASGLALGNATRPHPLFGPCNGYQWVLVTSQHERRHIRQIRRMAGFGDA